MSEIYFFSAIALWLQYLFSQHLLYYMNDHGLR